MSGIVGILHLDGAPLDEGLLQRLTAYQAFRGPDAQKVWVNHRGGAQIGFGHALLKTTAESEQMRGTARPAKLIPWHTPGAGAGRRERQAKMLEVQCPETYIFCTAAMAGGLRL